MPLSEYVNQFWEFLNHPLQLLDKIFISHAGVVIYCLLIVVLGLFFGYRLWSKINPIIKELKQANDEISKIEGMEGFVNKYHEFDDFCQKKSILCNCWNEFTEALLFPGTDFENGKCIRNTKQPGHYFSHRTILWPRVSMRFYNSLPNLLTGFGILGTFIGLVAGISLAAPGLNSSDIQDAKDALEKLLSGASLAFLTSIFGLASSIIFSWFEKNKVHKFDTSINEFIEGLEKRLEYISAEKISCHLLLESQKQTSSLESFSNDVAISLGDILENKITVPMNSTIIDLGKIMEEQKLILEGLRADQQKASDETLERLIEKFSESISGAAGQEMKAFAETIVRLSENLDTQIITMAQSQADMQKASQESVQKLQDSFHENTQQLQQEVSSAISTMVNGVKETVSDMTKMLQEATSESAANMRNVSEQFRSSIDALKKTVSSMSQKMQEATEESAQNMLKISEQFDNSIATLKETVNDMSTINDGTQKILDEVDGLIAAIHESRGELLKAATPIQQSTNEMLETSNVIKNAAEIMSGTGTALKEDINIIRLTHNDLKESWNNYQQRFEDVDGNLAAIFKELEQGLSTYASSTKNYVEQLDQHASTVVTHLAGATSELREDIEALGDVIDSFINAAPNNAIQN